MFGSYPPHYTDNMKKYRKEDLEKNVSGICRVNPILKENESLIKSIKDLLKGKTTFEAKVILVSIFDDTENESIL